MIEPITYASTTPRHGLPLLFAGQAQKEFFVNDALARLDMLVQPLAEAIADTPPADPAAGQCWLVGQAPTGAFAGFAGALAMWDGTGFLFTAASPGMSARLRDTGSAVFGSAGWELPAQPASPTGGSVIDVEARGAIATVIETLRALGVFS